nr:flagellar hook-length control protein FliK [Pleionea sp. CnH1-48]
MAKTPTAPVIENVTALPEQSLKVAQDESVQAAKPVSTTPLDLYSRNWQGDFSQKINWMKQSGLETAQIELDPPELGPLNVKIVQQNGVTQIAVQVHHSQTRDLIEQNLDRLRDSLSESGIELGNLDVSSQQQEGDKDSQEAQLSQGAEQESQSTTENTNNAVTGSNTHYNGLSLFA